MEITYKQLAELQHPDYIYINEKYLGGVRGCPKTYGYTSSIPCSDPDKNKCEACWNTEIPYPVYAIAKHDGRIPGTLYEFHKGDKFLLCKIKSNLTIRILYETSQYLVDSKDFDIYVDYPKYNSTTTKTKENDTERENKTMEYKVGDRVRIKTWEKMAQEFDVDEDGDIRTSNTFYFNKSMKQYCEKIYVIKNANYYNGYYYRLEGIDDYTFNDDMFEQKELTKEDLKTGMIVEYRDKTRGIIIGDTIVELNTFLSMSNLTDNLKYSNSHYPNNDIMKVYEGKKDNSFRNMLSYPGKLIWQRYETKEISMDEAMKIIAKHIGTKDFKIKDPISE